MTGSESALLVPLAEAEGRIGEWRSLYDPSCAAGVPAHVTLIYPFVPPDAIDDALLQTLAAHFAAARPFDVAFPRLARFPGVIYLAPEPAQPFRALIAGLVKRWPEYPPYRGAHEEVVPHLTIADRRAHLDLVLMNRVEVGVAPLLPFADRASEVWLMTSRRGRWRRKARFALGAR